MTWLEIGVWLLVIERAFAVFLGFIAGARAAYRVMSAPRAHRWRASASSTTVPDFVEVHSDDAVALDYSSGPKRH